MKQVPVFEWITESFTQLIHTVKSQIRWFIQQKSIASCLCDITFYIVCVLFFCALLPGCTMKGKVKFNQKQRYKALSYEKARSYCLQASFISATKATQIIRDTEQAKAKQPFMKLKIQGGGAMQNIRWKGKRQRLEKELPTRCTMRLFNKVVCKQVSMLSMALLCLPRASNKPHWNRFVSVITLSGNARLKGRMPLIYPNPYNTKWDNYLKD